MPPAEPPSRRRKCNKKFQDKFQIIIIIIIVMIIMMMKKPSLHCCRATKRDFWSIHQTLWDGRAAQGSRGGFQGEGGAPGETGRARRRRQPGDLGVPGGFVPGEPAGCGIAARATLGHWRRARTRPCGVAPLSPGPAPAPGGTPSSPGALHGRDAADKRNGPSTARCSPQPPCSGELPGHRTPRAGGSGPPGGRDQMRGAGIRRGRDQLGGSSPPRGS